MIKIGDMCYRDMKPENMLIVVSVRFSDILYGLVLVERFMEE